jgi:hypothetical protein
MEGSLTMTELADWRVSGSYFETCNCMAVCPCRRQDGKPGRRSTFGLCQFLLTWRVLDGAAGDLDLAGRTVAMAGFYNNDEDGAPWSVILYVDSAASEAAREALAAIFLGRAGGDVFFTANIGKVLAVRSADIAIDHTRGRERVRIAEFASANVEGSAGFEGVLTCAIPGHHHPGEEEVAGATVNDGALAWSYEGRCAFATDFAHSAAVK